ncbi:WSC-domain-containing protein [Calocera viscosa TUFC12733]|uniref:WSC-domain-containing protein n=1 Tax=Calocera viscosa (strain TUFC12733) TaxID=1330018 RepID=A0A167H9B6_CALVF|nr:WSC-domain-containing protein [Calocera viscosa TUFC12733]
MTTTVPTGTTTSSVTTSSTGSAPTTTTVSSVTTSSTGSASTTTTIAIFGDDDVPIVTDALSVSGTVTVTVPLTVSQPTTTATGTQLAAPPAYTFAGCFAEPTDSITGEVIHSVANLTTVEPELTVEVCVDICAGLNYPYAAVEAGDECYCSDGLYYGAVPASVDACATVCAGDDAETCGGTNHFDLYAE